MNMKAFFVVLQVGEYLVYLRGFLHPLFIVLDLVLIVGPKLFIDPGAKAFFFRLSSVSDPGL
jgi:hypothetical protein